MPDPPPPARSVGGEGREAPNTGIEYIVAQQKKRDDEADFQDTEQEYHRLIDEFGDSAALVDQQEEKERKAQVPSIDPPLYSEAMVLAVANEDKLLAQEWRELQFTEGLQRTESHDSFGIPLPPTEKERTKKGDIDQRLLKTYNQKHSAYEFMRERHEDYRAFTESDLMAHLKREGHSTTTAKRHILENMKSSPLKKKSTVKVYHSPHATYMHKDDTPQMERYRECEEKLRETRAQCEQADKRHLRKLDQLREEYERNVRKENERYDNQVAILHEDLMEAEATYLEAHNEQLPGALSIANQ